MRRDLEQTLIRLYAVARKQAAVDLEYGEREAADADRRCQALEGEVAAAQPPSWRGAASKPSKLAYRTCSRISFGASRTREFIQCQISWRLKVNSYIMFWSSRTDRNELGGRNVDRGPGETPE